MIKRNSGTRSWWLKTCVIASACLAGGTASCAFAADTSAATDTGTVFFAEKTGDTPAVQRVLRGKGGKVSVWVDPCKVSDVKFKEEKRETRFVEDLTEILKQKENGAPCLDTNRKEYTYALTETRARVTLTAKAADNSDVGTLTVVTGPPEHLFVSLDLPVSNRKTLKYDSKSGTLQPSSSNPQLYWAVDYQFGDLFGVSDSTFEVPDNNGALHLMKASIFDRLNFKVLFQASSKPLNSFGVALGYSLPPIETQTFHLNLSSLSIFAGYFWTKQDTITNGLVKTDDTYEHSWRIGVSYSLDDALKFVKL